MTPPLCKRFEATASFGEQLLSHRQVTLCPRKIRMAKIGCKLGQKIIQVSVPAIPARNAVNRRRMPEVVQPRLTASAALPANAGNAQRRRNVWQIIEAVRG